MAADGHEVTAAVNWRRFDRSRLAPLAEARIPVRLLNLGAHSGMMAKMVRRFMPHEKWEIAAARRAITASRPQTIVVSQGNDISALPFLELAHAMGIPCQVVTHGVNPAIWPVDEVSDRLSPAFTKASCTYWVAGRNVQEFEHHIGERLSNAVVVRNPVKVDRDAPFQWPAFSGAWRMACVARLQTRAKGHDLLLQALAAEEWRERDLQLTFFGEGENRRGLERLAALLGISERVRFAGHVNHVQDVWRDHHLIAQPSRNEGMPLSLVEALMCGRPALATDVAGHAELLTDGANGFVAEAATVRHIGMALERAWNARGDWEAMGRSAYARIRQDIPADPASEFAHQILSRIKV